jgi:hypothetical protein
MREGAEGGEVFAAIVCICVVFVETGGELKD